MEKAVFSEMMLMSMPRPRSQPAAAKSLWVTEEKEKEPVSE